jgi:hypothetical protein
VLCCCGGVLSSLLRSSVVLSCKTAEPHVFELARSSVNESRWGCSPPEFHKKQIRILSYIYMNTNLIRYTNTNLFGYKCKINRFILSIILYLVKFMLLVVSKL